MSGLSMVLAEPATRGLAWLASLTFWSTAVWAMVVLVARLVPRRSPDLRHVLLSLVLLRLLVPPGLASPLSAWELPLRWLETGPGGHSPVAAWPPHASLHATPGVSTERRQPPSWPIAVLLCWAAGAIWTGRRVARRRQRYRRLAASAPPIGEASAAAALASWRRRLGIRRRVRLVAGDEWVMPFTLGTVHPVVVLPQRLLAERQPLDVESIIAHELAHVARFDDLWLGLQHLAQTLFFFHPVVWLTAAAMGRERELDCDRRVLDTGILPATSYGRALLRVLRLDSPTSVATAATPCRKGLAMRIRQIADRRPGGRNHPLRNLAFACLLGLVLLPAGTVHPAPAGDFGSDRAPRSADAPESAQPPGGATAVNPPSHRVGRPPSLDDLMPGARTTSPFGARRHPFDRNLEHHDGIDLSTGEESTVHAPASGIVEVATDHYREGEKFGSVVIVDHGGGVETFYAHLAEVAVEPRQRLAAGDVIGIAGSTGVSSGPHLHFEIWQDGEKLDPQRIGEVLGGE